MQSNQELLSMMIFSNQFGVCVKLFVRFLLWYIICIYFIGYNTSQEENQEAKRC